MSLTADSWIPWSTNISSHWVADKRSGTLRVARWTTLHTSGGSSESPGVAVPRPVLHAQYLQRRLQSVASDLPAQSGLLDCNVAVVLCKGHRLCKLRGFPPSTTAASLLSVLFLLSQSQAAQAESTPPRSHSLLAPDICAPATSRSTNLPSR